MFAGPSRGTRADFNRAVALLHSFEYRPAIEGFQKVLAVDATCATAYWGIAVAQWGNPFGGIKTGPLLERGRDAVQKGLSTGSPTPRERAYISAIGELYKDAATVPHRDRTLAYAKAMEALQRDNPKDVEARIFYALAVNQTALATDKTYAAIATELGVSAMTVTRLLDERDPDTVPQRIRKTA